MEKSENLTTEQKKDNQNVENLYNRICKFLSQQYDSGNNNPTTKQLLATVMNANSQQGLHP